MSVDGYEAYMDNARTYTRNGFRKMWYRLRDLQPVLKLYKDSKIVSLSVGNGPERGHSGGSGIRAAMALQALTGNHGKLGAGVFAKHREFLSEIN